MGTIRRLSGIRHWYTWLIDAGLRRDNPTDGIRLREPRHPPKPPIATADLPRLLAAMGTLRNRTILLVFLDSGVRLAEMVRMRVDDVDLEAGTIRIDGKGQRWRYVALGRLATAELAKYVGDRTSGPLWLSAKRPYPPLKGDGIYFAIKRAALAAGMSGVTPRRFRTTFACEFYEASGHDFRSTQIAMGHTKAATTLHYLGWPAAEKALQQQRAHSIADALAGQTAGAGRR